MGVGDLGTWVTIGDSCGVRRAFMPEVLEYIKEGAAPWGRRNSNSGSEFVLMQTGLSLVVRPRG